MSPAAGAGKVAVAEVPFVPVLVTGVPTIGADVFAPKIWSTWTSASVMAAAPVTVNAAVVLVPSAQNSCTADASPGPLAVLTTDDGSAWNEPLVGPPLTERVGVAVLSWADTITSTTEPLVAV